MDARELDHLLPRARRHEPEALHLLIEAYSPRVYGLLYRLTGSRETAEDLLQETFLRMVRTIGAYEHRGRFEAWLFRIAANLARDHARRSKRRGVIASLDGPGCDGEPFAADLPNPRQDSPGQGVIETEAGQRLEACLENLAETDREIILLRHFSELSFREIAAMLGIPLGTALARAHRALKRLRSTLCDEDEV